MFVSGLVHMLKMSGRQVMKGKRSLVKESTMGKGRGNAIRAMRSTTRSSVTFSPTTSASASQLQKKRNDLMNRQHECTAQRNEARAKRIAAVTDFDTRCDQCKHFISESENDLDQKRLQNV